MKTLEMSLRLSVLLATHRSEFVDTCCELLGLSEEEAHDCLRDFEAGALEREDRAAA